MVTPFSGLSLIAHLAIIGFSKILTRQKYGVVIARKEMQPASTLRRGLRSLTSVLVLGTVSATMLFSLSVALTTGLRTGAHEWHIRLIRSEVEHIRTEDFNALYIAMKEWFKEPEARAVVIQTPAPTAAASTPAIFTSNMLSLGK